MFSNTAFTQSWIASTNAPNKEWWAVASSADGKKLVAAVYGGGIYTSTNAGLTWISNNAPSRQWYSVASSADGTKLVAVINILSTSGLGGIYTNNGINWTLASAPANLHSWDSVASSADGTTIVAAGAQALTHQIYTSMDSGNSWNLASVPNLPWYSVACSTNGTKMAALAWQTNVVYTSADSGITWVSNAIPNNWWYAIASSADGTKLVAVAESPSGVIYTSTNSGTGWISNNVPNWNWLAVASSSDGNKLVAVGPNTIFTSANSGINWMSNGIPGDPGNYCASVASSTDGNRLAVAAATGKIFTAQPTPPILNSTLFGTNLAVSWPSVVTGFQLQQSLALAPASWTAVNNTLIVSNGQNRVIMGTTNRQSFFSARISLNFKCVLIWRLTPLILLPFPSAQHAVQIMPRVAFGHVDDFFRRAFGHNFPAARAAFGTEVNNPVRRFDHVQIVLDDEQRCWRRAV